jgi:hypothetical protein
MNKIKNLDAEFCSGNAYKVRHFIILGISSKQKNHINFTKYSQIKKLVI